MFPLWFIIIRNGGKEEEKKTNETKKENFSLPFAKVKFIFYRKSKGTWALRYLIIASMMKTVCYVHGWSYKYCYVSCRVHCGLWSGRCALDFDCCLPILYKTKCSRFFVIILSLWQVFMYWWIYGTIVSFLRYLHTRARNQKPQSSIYWLLFDRLLFRSSCSRSTLPPLLPLLILLLLLCHSRYVTIWFFLILVFNQF